MLSAPPRTPRPTAASQAGFTLVELLVAMSIGLVVMFAVTGIMIVSLRQSQRTFTSVDATRQARTALATIENELHSACVNGDAPVQPTSDGSNLNFLSYTGGAANPTPVWHVLSYSGGTLTDSVYPAVYTATSTGHTWTQGTPRTSQTTLLTNVTQQPARLPVLPVHDGVYVGRQHVLVRARRQQHHAGHNRQHPEQPRDHAAHGCDRGHRRRGRPQPLRRPKRGEPRQLDAHVVL